MIVDPDRRDFMRLNVSAEALVVRVATGEKTLVQVLDLSASGCGFNSGMDIQLNEQVEIVLKTPSPALEDFRRLGTVATVTPSEQGQNRVGIVFREPPPPP